MESQIHTDIQKQNHQIVFFDGICNFCNASINFIIDHDPEKLFKFIPLQSELAQNILEYFGENRKIQQDFDSVILLKNNILYKKSSAAIEIAAQLNSWVKYLKIFRYLPEFLRNPVYDFIAKYRYQIFGKSDKCRIPTPELRDRFL